MAERDNDMSSEMLRLGSFTAWPPGKFPVASNLAAAGFYFMGPDDTVKCFSCGGTICDWKQGMLPDNEHRKRYPDCDLVKNREVLNKPMLDPRATNLVHNQVMTLFSAQEQVPNQMGMSFINMNLRTSAEQRPGGTLPQSPPGPNNLGMLHEDVRLATFDAWPYENMVPASRLATAGFYYLPQDERVQCFFCALSIEKQWLAHFTASAHQAPSGQQCPFVQELKVR